MNSRTDTTDTLGINPGVFWRTSFQYQLETTPHLGRRPGVGNLTAIHFHIYSEMTFYSGNRIKGYASHVQPPYIKEVKLLVSDLESGDFFSWQGNRGFERRRTPVRRTSKVED